MITTIDNPIPTSAEQTSLADRFILTQVEHQTLVFPATWVAEILRIERSQILDLPFYDDLLLGVANYNGQITPLIVGARLLQVEHLSLPDRLVVVRLNQNADRLGNVGIIVDRAIGSSTRDQLPSELFITNDADDMVMMRSLLVPIRLWQPKYWSGDN
jgi:chemotaxis signal transduction protein